MTLTTNSLDASLEQGTGGKAPAAGSNILLWQVANAIIIVAKFIVGFVAGTKPMLTEVSYINPFFPAFFIWLVIHAGELTFTVWQLLQRPGTAPEARLAAIRALSPWWIAAHTFTMAYSLTSEITWLEALELTGVSLSLCFAHLIVMEFKENPDFIIMNVPITMHFGWVTAAALLEWNGWVAESTPGITVKLASAAASLVAAFVVGGNLAASRRTPVLAGTVAWAVFWVGMGSLLYESLAEELGAAGAYTLGAIELVLAAGLVAVAVKFRGEPQSA